MEILGLIISMVVTILHVCTREPITNRNFITNLYSCSMYASFADILGLLWIQHAFVPTFNCQFSSGSTYGIVAIILYCMTRMFHYCIYKQETSKKASGEVIARVKGTEAEAAEEAKEMKEGGDEEEPKAATEEP